MNLLYPEMDSPSGPSIMGSENPKFAERRNNGHSDSDSMSEPRTPMEGMSSSMLGSRRSKDGLTREERMKLVRERQMEEHKRRLDELRQTQNQAMKAKHQQDEDRRRRLEEIKSRDEQRRSAVEARRKRMEDEERARCEAILRKHQEIFNRIESKRRQHESRKMAYGLSTYQLSDQDAGYLGSQSSRRAVSASALSRRPAATGSLTARGHNQSSSRFSSGSVQSARTRPSPSTPSKNGGGLFDSISGSNTASSDNSPDHSTRTRQRHRMAQSHPPPVSRSRIPETARSKPGSRPPTAQQSPAGDGTQSARAKRPTSLMTRSVMMVERVGKSAASTPETSFRTMSKRSQSVGNVSARNRTKPPVTDTLKPATSQGDMVSPVRTEEVRFEDTPTRQSPEPVSGKTGRKVISEAEAKAALAEKRRLARLKLELERSQAPDELSLDLAPPASQPPSSLGVDSEVRVSTPRRASEIEFLELEKSFTEESAANEVISSSYSRIFPVIMVGSTAAVKEETNLDGFSPLPEEESVGSGVLTNGGSESPEGVGQAKSSEHEREMQEVVVERRDYFPTETVIREEPVVPENKKESVESSTDAIVRPADVTEEEVTVPVAPTHSPAEMIRLETDRRRMEQEQREEEERIARRQRLEAIKRLTKGDTSAASTGFRDSTERLASPATETAKPLDALENARKLLQRRGLGGTGSSEISSMTSSPSLPAFGTAFPVDSEPKVNGNGSHKETAVNLADEMRPVMSPLSDASSTDTVSLNGYIRSHDGEDVANGFSTKTVIRNGSVSGMSESSSVDFDPYTGKDHWPHVNGSNGDDSRPDIWHGSSSTTAQHASLTAGNGGDLLLNFESH